ncbi:MAG TPA: hypothetical protein VIY52_13780 [Streptosporangiaceae bacterium]
MTEQLGRRPQYEAFADEFLAHAEDGFYNAHYDRPACLSLLGDDTRIIHETWTKGWQVSYWLVPLETTCEEIFQAGFLIERLLEPRPAREAAAVDPEHYEKLTREPRGFIAFRLAPRPPSPPG